MDAVTRRLREHPAFDEGRAAADVELAGGQLGYRLCGKPSWPVCDDAAAILRERFGVRVQVDGSGLTPLEVAARAQGYNERMEQEIRSRFGRDVVSEVFREVERKHKKVRKKSRPR